MPCSASVSTSKPGRPRVRYGIFSYGDGRLKIKRFWYFFLFAACQAAAQTADRSDARELRGDALLSAQESAERGRPPVDYRILLGAAYTDAESGERRWATPFQLRVRFNERKSYLKFSGDGLVSSRSDEGELSGLANLHVVLGHRLAEGVRGWAGVTLPTGGEVGSSHGRIRVGASYEHEIYGPWSAQIKGQLVRFNADPEPGESRMRRQLLGQLVYGFDPYTLLLGQLERIYRPGVAGATIASLGYQKPIGRTAGGVTLGIVTLSRGLSAGGHDTTIELDIGLRY